MVEMGGRRVEEVALIHSAERTILRVRPLDKRPRQTLHRREWLMQRLRRIFNGSAFSLLSVDGGLRVRRDAGPHGAW